MDATQLLWPSDLSGWPGRAPDDRIRARPGRDRRWLGAIGLVALLAGCQAVTLPPLANLPAEGASPPLAVGDTWVYRVVNGYNDEVRGQIRDQVEKTDAVSNVISVTPDTPGLGQPYTVVFTKEGNWLRHPLTNHDQPVEYDFVQAYPAYAFPLYPGKSWSARVNASHPATGKINSVRVDGTVLGAERIRVPAGEFDTLKIRRLVYAGDWDGFRRETNIIETDWYAPALGRAVRSESKSEWQDMSRCGRRGGCLWFRGDWNIHELVAFSRAPRS